MADTNELITVVEGDLITAETTNDNNRYLESLMATYAGELRQYLEQQIAQLSGNFFKPGYYLDLPFDVVPTGFLKCDGSSLLRSEYDDLFDVIGTIYGSVDDYHFNLPNWEGKFSRVYGGQSASLGVVQEAGLPNITGRIDLQNQYFGSPVINGAFSVISSSESNNSGDGGSRSRLKKVDFDASRSSLIYQNDITDVRPYNMAVIRVIKY